jgi:hypothetical protein
MASTTTRNPATTISSATGKRQGPPRKPLTTTVVGSMGTRTTQPTRPARKVAAKATPKAPAKATPKATPASRQLPRNLLAAVATWASQAKLSPADQQRVANYMKVVTSGTDAQGARYWPTAADLPKGVRPLPRPSHHSWDARS